MHELVEKLRQNPELIHDPEIRSQVNKLDDRSYAEAAAFIDRQTRHFETRNHQLFTRSYRELRFIPKDKR